MNKVTSISDVDNTRFLLAQLLSIGCLLAQIALIAAAFIHVRRQSLPVRDQLFWDVVILFVPVIGAIMAFLHLRSQNPVPNVFQVKCSESMVSKVASCCYKQCGAHILTCRLPELNLY